MAAHTTPGATYAKKCKRFITTRGVKAEQLHFKESVHTVKDAIRLTAAKGTGLVVVKTIVLAARYAVGEEGVEDTHYVACVVRGDKRVDLGKMRDVLGTKKIRIATPKEVLEHTGYPAGGVPPFGYDLPLYIDDDAMELSGVLAGGGSDRALVRTTMKEIARVTDAHVERISRRQKSKAKPTRKKIIRHVVRKHKAHHRHVIHKHSKNGNCIVCVRSRKRGGSMVCIHTR